RGGDDRVADIGVDLHEEIAADDHRLGFRMVDVVWDDRAAPRDLFANKLWGHAVGDRRAERLAVRSSVPRQFLTAEVLAVRDIFHPGRDDPAPCIGGLRCRTPGFRAKHLAPATIE